MNCSTNLFKNDNVEINSRGRFIIAALLKPHQALSTSFVNGGQTNKLQHLVNHQCCEAEDHKEQFEYITTMGPNKYHSMVCRNLNLNPDTTAIMSTAANMQYAFLAKETFQEIEVCSLVTAGVIGNAGRAADPASWHEGQEDWEKLNDQAGTINTMLFINWPLTSAALSRAVVTMTEAKTVALQELSVSSRKSSGLATGTGTDQFCIAALQDKHKKEKTWAGKQTKLGELIAKAVIKGTKEALRWQNGLEPSLTRSIVYALERYGLSEEKLKEEIKKILDARSYELFIKNFEAVIFEPQIAACAYAIAAIQDRLKYGTLPSVAAEEVLVMQCALMASQLATKPQLFKEMHQELSKEPLDLISRICTALALGWKEKWK